MNPIFVLIVIICAAVVWMMSSFLFRFIGDVVGEFVSDVRFAMFTEDEEYYKTQDDESDAEGSNEE